MTSLVLIVEDSESLALSLAMGLESMAGVQAVVAHDGREALRRFAPGQPSIAAMITDYNLPSLSGLELMREVRALNGYQHLPVILITADEALAQASRPLPDHPNAIFKKPFSIKEVCRALQALLH